MGSLLQDFRFAGRTLSKSPGFVLVAVLSLGLGIGANTAIFSLINAVMLRLLPVAHPEQLVLLTDPGASGIHIDTTEHGVREILAYPEFEELRTHNQVFSGMFAAQSALGQVDVVTGRGAAEQAAKARMQLVSGEFFGVLGVQPVLGRAFTPAEDRTPGANPVAVISYGFWQRRFGADPGIVGKTLRVGRATFQILGVAPEGFRGMLVGSEADLWLPLTMQEQALPGRNYLRPRDVLWLQVMARLAPGISRAKAGAAVNVEFQQILRGWAAALPNEQERRDMLDQKIELRPGARGASPLRDQFSDPLVLLMAMVGLVLLIACSNIANLMLARANGRQREIGVRLALGAGRARLIRLLLTESILVAALGGILGALLANSGTDVLIKLVAAGGSDPALGSYRDLRVFLFTAGISLLTGILFGLAPAMRATRLDVNQALAANVRGSSGSRGSVRTGRVLVVAQVALSLLLLMGATLFVRSLHNLVAQKLGFNRDHLLMVEVDPTGGGYKGAAVPALYLKLREALQTIPGVRAVTISNNGFFRGDAGDQISLEGSDRRGASELRSRWTLVGPGYFSAVGIPLLRGRDIDAADAAHGSPVCVINESFARYFFANSDPIGKHVTDEYPTTRETFEIVGVAADAREHSLAQPDRPRFYGNLFHPIGTIERATFILNSSGDPNALISAARQAISAIDRGLPVLGIRSVNEQIDRRLVTQRLIADLSAFFGSLALLMAAIGLYGVMSYSMTRRTSEIGIRMALGASQRSVLWLVLRETFWLVVLGVAAGLPCALAAGRLIAARLFGLTPADPATIALAVTIIFGATLLAGYIPARRASRVDPMVSLRCE
ncbi:Permease [Candidatus Sulfopaludibacter sp. SbA6]|nr:Permease [Candidatus Sulfopaludibacter sp. SbA6]